MSYSFHILKCSIHSYRYNIVTTNNNVCCISKVLGYWNCYMKMDLPFIIPLASVMFWLQQSCKENQKNILYVKPTLDFTLSPYCTCMIIKTDLSLQLAKCSVSSFHVYKINCEIKHALLWPWHVYVSEIVYYPNEEVQTVPSPFAFSTNGKQRTYWNYVSCKWPH